MKNTKTVIPLKMREEMAKDPFYSTCSMFGQHGHVCGGDLTWEHAIIAKGKKVQLSWAIIPLCEKGHAINNFQDAGTMRKDLNEWIALSRALEVDILALFGETFYTSLCKAKGLIQRKTWLIKIYGEYKRIIPQSLDLHGNVGKLVSDITDVQRFASIKGIKIMCIAIPRLVDAKISICGLEAIGIDLIYKSQI